MARKVTFVLVILGFHHQDIYTEIKYLGDTQCGVATACMKWNRISRGASQYISNVALKLNLKLGGANHTIQRDCLGSLRSGRKMIVSSSSFDGTEFKLSGFRSGAELLVALQCQESIALEWMTRNLNANPLLV
jgi:hypothetical protein